MRKRLSILVAFVLVVFIGNAQLSLSIQEPPAGIVQKNQLWNLTLIYSGNTSVNITIGLSLIDLSDNQPVMTAYTRPLTLIKGVKQLRYSEVSPVQYNYLTPSPSRLADAFLAIGNYRVCYTVYNGAGHSEEIFAEDCISIEVAPLSPPQLSMPADSAKVETPYPQFAWLPPTPITLFSDLNYDILVTEVRQGQIPEEAIQENMPVYNMRHLITTVSNYPSSNKSLDTGKIYAWRVMAKNGEVLAAQSDVWTFRITHEKPGPLTPVNGMYMELKNDFGSTNTGIIPDDVLGIKYYSYDKTHDAVIRFTNDQGEVIKEINKTIQYGNNFLVIKLDHSFSKEKTYFVEISDLQTSRYRASFRMSN
jgi:hypothetical protein